MSAEAVPVGASFVVVVPAPDGGEWSYEDAEALARSHEGRTVPLTLGLGGPPVGECRYRTWAFSFGTLLLEWERTA